MFWDQATHLWWALWVVFGHAHAKIDGMRVLRVLGRIESNCKQARRLPIHRRVDVFASASPCKFPKDCLQSSFAHSANFAVRLQSRGSLSQLVRKANIERNAHGRASNHF